MYMQQERIDCNFKAGKIIFWILTAICMGVIFYFSSRTATQSSGQSNIIVAWLQKLFGENTVTDFIVRKSAHCLEFTGLCVLFNCAFFFTFQKKKPLISILCTSLYAVTDEVHQIFVEGRSCELRDWGIDTFGALLGTIGFLVLFYMIDRIVNGKFIQNNN